MPPKASTSKATAAAKVFTNTCWLLKAEPETRMEKGVDVAFGIDKFAAVKTTSWEGVRNHEAKRILKEGIKLDQRCLVYHSNCKTPGVAGLAKCIKEGYPDYNAWDPKHPYFDPKSREEAPTWFMVDVEFVSKFEHFVPLKLLQTLVTFSSPPDCTPYISDSQLKSIKAMALLNRGRLSVQPVEEDVYEAIVSLGTEGGWEELLEKKKAAPKTEEEVEEDEDEKEGGKKRKSQARPKRGAKKSKA
ncbi:hypothetical protein MNV49_005386 [Pseudohyphozyma bogoriensis]|nr:hypothetical protein MNV49_005386 [Pseudohyphozyma bogoriensis]